MSVMLSTGLRNARLGGASLRNIFDDAILRIYTGSAPAAADNAETGSLLVTLTKASGAVAPGAVSIAKECKIVISGTTLGQIETVTINAATVPEAYSYTNGGAETNITIAANLATLINASTHVGAHASGSATIYLYAKKPGVDFTIAIGGTGVGNMTLTDNTVTTVIANTLKFGDPAAGVLSKNSDIWSGVVAAAGVAGYFRLVQSSDDGTSSATQSRLQGNVATSGQEMTISNTTLAVGATQTIDTASITEPAS